jgi:predicted RNA binding protein YcfA (HicA-like mRNA interferase family)
VVLADVGRGDCILCQITSKPYGDASSIELDNDAFASGSLRVVSYARPTKLFTANENLITSQVAHLKPDVLRIIAQAVTRIVNAGKLPWVTKAAAVPGDGQKRAAPERHRVMRPEPGGDILWPVKVRDLISKIEADGWFEVRTKGSHRQFRHPTKPGTVTVAGKPGVEVPPGTLNSALKQAGLKK